MTKNTKANLTLIFNINRKSSEIELSNTLDAIARQIDKNFNIIFVFNSCLPIQKTIFSKFDFKGINKISYVNISENLGDSFTFNYCLRNNVETKYVFYLDSNLILKPDFVLVINNFLKKHPETDILSVFGVPNIYFKQEYIEIKTLSDDFCNRPLVFFGNKILSVEYLIKNNIKEPYFKHYPVYFYVMLFAHKPKWYSLGRQLFDITLKLTFPYNVFDLFDQCYELVSLLDTKEFKDHQSEIEYLCIITLFRNFVYAIFKTNQGNLLVQKRVLDKVEEFINLNFPNWQNNPWLFSDKNKNDKSLLDYLKDFKPKLIHVKKALHTNLFTIGYERKK